MACTHMDCMLLLLIHTYVRACFTGMHTHGFHVTFVNTYVCECMIHKYADAGVACYASACMLSVKGMLAYCMGRCMDCMLH